MSALGLLYSWLFLFHLVATGENAFQGRTIFSFEISSAGLAVVKVVDFSNLGPHHVEEACFTLFVEALNRPQEVINRLEAHCRVGIRDVDVPLGIPAEAELPLEITLGMFDGFFQRLVAVALAPAGDPDVEFIGEAVELAVEFTDQAIVNGVLLIAGFRIFLAAFDFPGCDHGFVGHHRVKTEVIPHLTEELENLIANLRQIVVGMKAVRGLGTLGLEGLDSGEIRIGQEFVTEGGQLLRKVLGSGHFQLAHDEEFGATVVANDDAAAALASEQGRITGFIDVAVDFVGHSCDFFDCLAILLVETQGMQSSDCTGLFRKDVTQLA